MKKLYSLLVLTLCLFAGMSANAQTVVFDFAANPWNLPLGSGTGETASAGDITEPIVASSTDNLSVELSFGGNPTNPARMWSGPQLRCYKGGTLTLTPLTEGKAITSVTFTAGKFALTAAEGTLSGKAWTGNHTSVTFSATGTNQITKMEVVLADADASTVTPGATVQVPVISPNGGTKEGSVKVSITGDSTTSIFYTIDGTDPTSQSTLYEAPFTLTQSATVKAIAYDGTGASSAIASMTYTIETADSTETTPTTKYFFAPAEVVVSGQKYLIVAQVSDTILMAKPVSKNYGYLYCEQATLEDGRIVTTSLDNAFDITESDDKTVASYTIAQSDGRLLYLDDSHNSFQVGDAPTEGQYWTIEMGNDAPMWTITNTARSKYVQYSKDYVSFGSYAEEQTNSLKPILFALVGEEEIPVDSTSTDTTTVVTDYETATFPFKDNPWQLETGSTSNTEGGAVAEAIVQDGAVMTVTNGGGSTVVRMWDSNGNVTLRVYNGTAITFSAADKAVVGVDFTTNGSMNLKALQGTLEGKSWTGNAMAVTFVGTGTTQIQTVTLKLSDITAETEQALLYIPAPVISPKAGEKTDSVVVSIAAAEGAYIYYTTDGNTPTWNSTLYSEPFTLKESATVKAIAYDDEGNGSSVTEAAYTIVASASDSTSTTVTTYSFQRATSIEAGKQYLFVANVNDTLYAAKALSSNYGYLKADEVAAVDGVITVDDPDLIFTISAGETEGGASYVIAQNDARKLYMKGTYNSFNVVAAPDSGHVWTFTLDKDKTWIITNVAKNKYWQYSKSHTSFGCYAEAQSDGYMPELWVLIGSQEEEKPVDENVIFSEEATSSKNQFIVEDETLPSALTYIWRFDSNYGAVASGFDSKNKANLESASVMRTPVLNLTASLEEDAKYMLTFEQAIGHITPALAAGYFKLYVCPVTEQPTSTRSLKTVSSEWQEVPITFPELKEGKNFSDYEDMKIDLSEFAGKMISLAFRYTSDVENAGTWEIRNVEVAYVQGGDATAIEALTIEPAISTGAVYDLQGRRVINPTHGVYIVGGRKVYIK